MYELQFVGRVKTRLCRVTWFPKSGCNCKLSNAQQEDQKSRNCTALAKTVGSSESHLIILQGFLTRPLKLKFSKGVDFFLLAFPSSAAAAGSKPKWFWPLATLEWPPSGGNCQISVRSNVSQVSLCLHTDHAHIRAFSFVKTQAGKKFIPIQ